MRRNYRNCKHMFIFLLKIWARKELVINSLPGGYHIQCAAPVSHSRRSSWGQHWHTAWRDCSVSSWPSAGETSDGDVTTWKHLRWWRHDMETLTMVSSWHRSTFRITDHLWEESPVDSSEKGQLRGALLLPFMVSVWTNCWTNSQVASDFWHMLM